MATTKTTKNIRPIHANEFLKIINDAPDDNARKHLLWQHAKTLPLSMILSLNFSDSLVLELPEGAPPIDRNEQTHPDLLAPLSGQITRLKACLKTNPIPKAKKEQVFMQVVEVIPPLDGDVLVFAKDKKLTELYPNITKEIVAEVFPNYVR